MDIRKIFNFLKVHLSFFLSRISRRPVVWGKPYSMSVEPVNYCNLSCPECPVGRGELTRPRQQISAALFRKIINGISPELMYLMLYFQGEPYLHRNIFELIEIAASCKLYTAISTNAQLISGEYAEKTVRSGLHRIIISMDGMTQDVYEAYRRGGQLGKVLEGIRNLRRWRERLKSKTPYIIVQFIVFRTNQHQLAGIRRFALSAGADRVEIKTAQLYDFESGNPLMTGIGRYSRYKRTPEGGYAVRNRLANRCLRLWNGTVITAGGKVVPCCFDKDGEFVLADLNFQNLNDVWKSPEYMNFRKKILHNRKQIGMCGNCTE